MYRFVPILLVCLVSSAFAATSKPTCGGSSSSKVIQLVNPLNPPRDCNYHINAYSSNVCQLRIDFAMTLAQPSLPGGSNDLPYAACLADYFQVGGLKLCGVETSQHIYVPFNRTAGVTRVSLLIVLEARVGGYSGLPKPTWDMKVTQLECPTGSALRSVDVENDILKPEARASTKDGFFLAPPGCLQYFPQNSGAISSFNYNNGNGVYPGKLNYAICFRRTTRTAALQLKSQFFRLGAEYNTLSGQELDNECWPQVRQQSRSEDYLLVPQSMFERNEVRASYFCGTSLQDDTIRSTNPGPLEMIFNSDGIHKWEKEYGFAFTYRIL